MRLFITSYQKSGTHQIMPMFSTPILHVVDRSWNCWIDVPERYRLNQKINWPGVEETVRNLQTFRDGSSKAFGHLSYLPEFAKVFERTKTKVLFNIRDPRDVVVAEYENAMRHYREGRKGSPLWNYLDGDDGKFLYEKDDPISELIILAAARWPRWTGWLDHDFVMPVKYEDLRLKQKETIEKIIEFLNGFGCAPVHEMMRRAQPRQDNPTFRRGIPGEWKIKFEFHHIKLANELLRDIIERLGYTF